MTSKTKDGILELAFIVFLILFGVFCLFTLMGITSVVARGQEVPFRLVKPGDQIFEELVCVPPETMANLYSDLKLCKSQWKIDVQKEKDLCLVDVSMCKEVCEAEKKSRDEKLSLVMNELSNAKSTNYIEYVVWTVTAVAVLLGVSGAVYLIRD